MSKIVEKPKKYKKTDAAKESINERRRKAFDMKIKGMTYEQIAEVLGVNSQTVWRDIQAVQAKLTERLRKLRKYPEIDDFWAARLASLEKRKLEAWAAMLESKRDRSKLQEVLVLIDKEIERAHSMAGIKLTDVNPEDLVSETFRVLVEGLPNRKKYNETFKQSIEE